MGVGYYTQVTQWSKGEYPGANNPQDDVTIIAGKLTNRSDDHGNTMAAATLLAVEPDGTVWSSNPEGDSDNIYPQNKGIIEKAADVDFFAFDHAGGAVSFTVTPAWTAFSASNRGADLDIEATLYDSLGFVVAISDPVTDTQASISIMLGPGRYYLAITGAGNTVTPYTDYGSLGQYFINGAVARAAIQADFTYSTIALQASFMDASTDNGGTITSWSWNFGDNSSSTAQNPSHAYADGGSYTVTLRVTDSAGRSADTSRIITVIKLNTPPTASFTFSRSNSTVTFSNNSTDSDGFITSFSWNFGDGSLSTTQNPSHPHAVGGTYTVTLLVTDNSGATSSVSKSVTISSTPKAPSNLTATVVLSGSRTRIKTVNLKWLDNSSNETGFSIQRCTETVIGTVRTCQFSDINSVGANVTTYRETPGSGTYKYRVRARNSLGSSAYSNEVRL